MENFLRRGHPCPRSSIFMIECLIYVLAQINGKFPHGMISEKKLTR